MRKFGIGILLLLCVNLVFGQEIFQTKAGAIKGYDPVAYFTESKPVKGKEQFKLVWNNATWYFASQEHKEQFLENPEKYAPAYGGYCAFGVAGGYKVKTEPEAWAIVNGTLYLNYDLGVQKEWNEDRKTNIEKADKNWASLKDE
ncbi:YHS domain-containing (seleno)protein [Fulvivirga sedimenti]|uniref:YHS domain-containing protein n=1 Tax=Fulvivirga sedimenti TaxID=2879465 RepID=A0A9X1HPL4_9BACT|nr:YHS domain-containing (seleno)protein [Fulvivirga sedimenti]MCA6075636.1 YHS domain-containing protein [Fulvivirga sedimenti]